MTRLRPFLVWLAVLTALWLFANRPRDGSGVFFWMTWVGWPFEFAYLEHGRLRRFDLVALAIDVAVWLWMVWLAWLCAWSRTRSADRQPPRADD